MTCQVWDYSLRADSVLAEAAVYGTPGRVAAGETCPAGAHGDLAMSNPLEDCTNTFSMTCPLVYLLNAVEILDDYVGNDDGFCSSSERCIYLPHMSAWPGDGTLVGPCTFEDGTVTGVELYGYDR